MKTPARLISRVEDGIIDEVLGQVKSGKEADIFVVRSGDEIRCAKIYKEANKRNFRQAVQYQEGRKFQNSRSARAMSKRTAYGQKEAEASWISAEVDALNKLSAAGLRVPKPFGFFDGVLIMELITGEDGKPAPQLNELILPPETAILYHEELITQIVWMLCSGIIHGDLSEFNVLVDGEGPVIIDMPQAVNAAGNNSAGMMFARDVNNMARYFGRFAPEILGLKYAKEIWALYEKGKLTPYVELTGQFQEPTKKSDVGGLLNVIGDARKEHENRVLRKNPGMESDGNRFRNGRTEESRGEVGPGRHRQDQSPGPRNGYPGSRNGRPDPHRPNGNRPDSQARPHPQNNQPGRAQPNPHSPASPHPRPAPGNPQGNPRSNPRNPSPPNPQNNSPLPPPNSNPWGRRAGPGGNRGSRT